MVATVLWVIAAIAAAWAALALAVAARAGIGFRQALLYAPMRLLWRIDDRSVRELRKSEAPVIYAIVHQAAIDPALMLCLLPPETLHILDPASASAAWLEPFRALARSISFRAEHVFVSRRLVRQLKGKGRLAVYFPGEVEPSPRAFRLYRAVARIAQRAGARVVPVMISNAQLLPGSLTPRAKRAHALFPRLRITALPALTIEELQNLPNRPAATAVNALFDRLAETRLHAVDTDRTLFEALRDAASRFGPGVEILEDAQGGKLTYRLLMIGARVLARRFIRLSRPGEAVGVLLPNANGMVVALTALQSAGRVVAMINYTAGPANIASAIGTAEIRTVLSSKAFIEKGELGDVVKAIEGAGARIVWLDELRETVTGREKATAALAWRRPVTRTAPGDVAVILFTSGSEGTPKAVALSSRNLVSNVRQAAARIEFSPADTLLNVLPAFHSFGLTGGTILPLISGVKLSLYPSPLHYKVIPGLARKVKPTVMFGTDTFLGGYARTAKDADFASVRMVVAGAEAVRPETRRVWRERFGAEIVEGFGMTECAPVVAVNTATHSREGTVGRLLPGISIRLEPVNGIAEGGRLWLSGPNVALGVVSAEAPGVIHAPVDGWHDSGDIVAIDRDGFIAIKGRAKRFAKIAGEMISLGAVEMLAHALWPDEGHAAVSVPDKRKGERIVLLTTGADVTRERLFDYGRKAGAPELMVPHEIIRAAEIPVLGSGKTDYPGARRLVLAHLGLEAA